MILKKDLKDIKGLYLVHRGLHSMEKGVPENSLLAFKQALIHYRDIEIDIQLLKDGEVVVFHDSNLKRMTGVDRYLYDCTYDEIKDLKLMGTEERIPLLKDVLRVVNGKVLLDIEFKYDLPAGFLEEAACKFLDNYNGKFIVTSFNPFSVRWFKKNRPNYIRGQLVTFKDEKTNFIKKLAFKKMVFNFLAKPDFVGYDINEITEQRANSIRKKGIPLFLWTVETREQFETAKRLGDSYIYEKIMI